MTQPFPVRWHTVDIATASAIAIVGGIMCWAWSLLWSLTEPAFAAFPPAQALLYGVWLVPAVVGALIIQKPGIAVYCGLLATVVSVALGNGWSVGVIVHGFVGGLATELAFLLLLYQTYNAAVASLSGIFGGLASTLFDIFVRYPSTSWFTFKLPYIICGTISSEITAGIGGWLLVTSLVRTGAIFPSSDTEGSPTDAMEESLTDAMEESLSTSRGVGDVR